MSVNIKNVTDASPVEKISRIEAVEKFRNILGLTKKSLTNESFNVLVKQGFNPEEALSILREAFEGDDSIAPSLQTYPQFNAPKHMELPGDGVIAAAWKNSEQKLTIAVETINGLIQRNNLKEVAFFGITAEADSELYATSLYSVVLEKVKDANPEVTFYVLDNMVGKNSVGGEQEKYRTSEDYFEKKYKFELVIVGANHLLSLFDGTKIERLLDNAVRNGYNVYDINTSLLYKAEIQ